MNSKVLIGALAVLALLWWQSSRAGAPRCAPYQGPDGIWVIPVCGGR